MLEKLKKKNIQRKQLIKISKSNGVYVFWNKGKIPIYVGKSVNLNARVRSYFSSKLFGKTKKMVGEAKFFSTIKVSSELEALLLEAELVKKWTPKYNFQLKDDKSALFIQVTNEDYPRILTVRKRQIKKNDCLYFGPFPNSKNVKSVLKMLRRIFPFSQHTLSKRACFYSQIGLCNPCPNEIEKIENQNTKLQMKREYKKNVRLISKILSGNVRGVRNSLEKEMKKLSKKESFEKAKQIREKLKKLDYITQPILPVDSFLKNPLFLEDVRKKEIEDFEKILIQLGLDLPKKPGYTKDGPLKRIECYDVAHLAGSYPTASMVTFINGEADKSNYRHFRIRQKKTQSDTDSMREVLQRRIKHLENWGRPDLIIVDGGIPQVSCFLKALDGENIPIVGLTKKQETLIIPKKRLPTGPEVASKIHWTRTRNDKIKKIVYIKVKVPSGPALNFLKRIRNEAHRFAQRYHHRLIENVLFTKEGKSN